MNSTHFVKKTTENVTLVGFKQLVQSTLKRKWKYMSQIWLTLQQQQQHTRRNGGSRCNYRQGTHTCGHIRFMKRSIDHRLVQVFFTWIDMQSEYFYSRIDVIIIVHTFLRIVSFFMFHSLLYTHLFAVAYIKLEY